MRFLTIIAAVAFSAASASAAAVYPGPTGTGLDCRVVLCARVTCQGNEELFTPKNSCCQQCRPRPDCAAVQCLVPTCAANEEIFVPAGQCCPSCRVKSPCGSPEFPVLCALPECGLNEEEVLLPGECCPRCQPKQPVDCAAVSCLAPTCALNQELFTPEGECCPVCRQIEGLPDCTLVDCFPFTCGPNQELFTPEGECCPVCRQIEGLPDCTVVRCGAPNCAEGEAVETPFGECCPQCVKKCPYNYTLCESDQECARKAGRGFTCQDKIQGCRGSACGLDGDCRTTFCTMDCRTSLTGNGLGVCRPKPAPSCPYNYTICETDQDCARKAGRGFTCQDKIQGCRGSACSLDSNCRETICTEDCRTSLTGNGLGVCRPKPATCPYEYKTCSRNADCGRNFRCKKAAPDACTASRCTLDAKCQPAGCTRNCLRNSGMCVPR